MRVKSLRRLLRNTDADAYLATDIKNVYYFTGFMDIPGSTLYLLIPLNNDPVLLVSSLSLAAAEANAKGCIVKGSSFGDNIFDKFIENIRDLKINTIHFDNLPAETYLELTKRCELKLISNPKLVWTLRRVKDETECAYIKKAAKLADIGVKAGIEAIKPGMKEYEVAAEIEYVMRSNGSEGTSFNTIVASGFRSAYPHALCSEKVINEGDLVLIDLGAVYAGYCSDITRTVVAGKPSFKQLRILNLVSKAQEKAFQNIRAETKARDVDASARKILVDGNLGKYFIHGLGHGVGLDVHEPPRLSISSEDLLEEGNVITDEPGVYIEGFGGVRIEDMVLVRKNQGKKLTDTPHYL